MLLWIGLEPGPLVPDVYVSYPGVSYRRFLRGLGLDTGLGLVLVLGVGVSVRSKG